MVFRVVLTGWRTTQRLCNTAKVDNDSLNAVSLSFNFGLETLHLVAVERVGDILREKLGISRLNEKRGAYPTNVKSSHS